MTEHFAGEKQLIPTPVRAGPGARTQIMMTERMHAPETGTGLFPGLSVTRPLSHSGSTTLDPFKLCSPPASLGSSHG